MKIQDLIFQDLETFSKSDLELLSKYYHTGNQIGKIAHAILREMLSNISFYNYQDQYFHQKWFNHIKFPFNLSETSWLRYAANYKQITTKDGYKLWSVTLPKGFRIYHGSKVLPLAHAEYPVKEPDCVIDVPENYNDVWKMKTCTTMSYYALPPDIAYYAAPQDPLKLIPPVLEAYGHPVAEGLGRRYGQGLSDMTIATFQLTNDTTFMILTLDQLLDRNATFGQENCVEFLRWVKTRYPTWLLELAEFATGQMPLIKQYAVFKKWLKGTGKTNIIKSWFTAERKVLHNIEVRTSNNWEELMTISSLYALKDHYSAELDQWQRTGDTKILYKISGFRWSTFEIDRAVFNMLLLFIREQAPEIVGYISDNIQRPQGICGGNDIEETCKVYTGNFSKTKRVESFLYNFHREMTLWFAPNYIERTPENPFDSRFGWNTNEILDEMRKYKTLNLVPKGFHQGHLAEHSIWTALYCEEWLNHPLFVNLGEFKNAMILGALLHDIGKMGDCSSETGFKQLDTKVLLSSNCHNKGTHFLYDEIADHPMRGYNYLTGRQKLKQYGLNLKDFKEIDDWDEFFSQFGLTQFEIKIIRVATAIHWDLGPVLGSDTFSPVEYLNKFEMFYHTEFPQGTSEITRAIVLQACCLISISDILGSESYTYLSQEKSSVNLCDYSTCKMWIRHWLENMNAIALTSQKPIIKKILNNIERCKELWVAPAQTDTTNNYNTLLTYLDDPVEKHLKDLIIAFDVDNTLLHWKGQSYKWVLGRETLIKNLQQWRPTAKLAIMSRHYRPKLLEKWLRVNDLIKAFDYILVQYTGTEMDIPGFFYKGGKRVELHLEREALIERNKEPHIKILKTWEPNSTIVLVDDDKEILSGASIPGITAIDNKGHHSLSQGLLERAIKIIAYKRDHWLQGTNSK